MNFSDIIKTIGKDKAFQRASWNEEYLYFNCENDLCFSIPFDRHSLDREDFCAEDWEACDGQTTWSEDIN